MPSGRQHNEASIATFFGLQVIFFISFEVCSVLVQIAIMISPANVELFWNLYCCNVLIDEWMTSKIN